MNGNQIETLDLSNSNPASLKWFDCRYNPLARMLLTDATLSQATFDRLMDGIEGNTLVVPEPATMLLLGFGGLMLRRRRAQVIPLE